MIQVMKNILKGILIFTATVFAFCLLIIVLWGTAKMVHLLDEVLSCVVS